MPRTRRPAPSPPSRSRRRRRAPAIIAARSRPMPPSASSACPSPRRRRRHRRPIADAAEPPAAGDHCHARRVRAAVGLALARLRVVELLVEPLDHLLVQRTQLLRLGELPPSSPRRPRPTVLLGGRLAGFARATRRRRARRLELRLLGVMAASCCCAITAALSLSLPWSPLSTLQLGDDRVALGDLRRRRRHPRLQTTLSSLSAPRSPSRCASRRSPPRGVAALASGGTSAVTDWVSAESRLCVCGEGRGWREVNGGARVEDDHGETWCVGRANGRSPFAPAAGPVLRRRRRRSPRGARPSSSAASAATPVPPPPASPRDRSARSWSDGARRRELAACASAARCACRAVLLRLRLLARPGALGVGGARLPLLRRHLCSFTSATAAACCACSSEATRACSSSAARKALRLLRRERRRLLQLPRAQQL